MKSGPRVAITGASGFVGRALVRTLADAGFDLVLLQRRAHGMANEIVVGPLECAAAVPGLSVDFFVHLAADPGGAGKAENARTLNANCAATRTALEMAQSAGVRRFVLLSSVKAVGETSPRGEPMTRRTEPTPTSEYGRSKLECEQLVKQRCSETETSWTIIRAPMVYGPGGGANLHALARLAAIPLPLPFGATRNARSLVFVENLTDFIRFALTSDAMADGVYYVADGQPLSTKQLLAELAAAQGRNVRFISVPCGLLAFIFKAIGKTAIAERLLGDLAVDSSDALAAGWTPCIPRKEAFERSLSPRMRMLGAIST